MRSRMTSRRAVPALVILTGVAGLSFAQAASAATISPASAASSGNTANVGWVRLADLSETLSPVDIYVVSSAGTVVQVDKNLSYGTIEGPLAVAAGSYTVDVRDAGASASSTPAAASSITVQAGRFYTVAPVEVTGSGNQRRVVDLPDAASTPAGDASVQAIDAAYLNGTITFNCDYTGNTGNVLTSATGGTTGSDAMPVGTWTETATGSNGKTTSQQITLAADTARTEIILDTTTGLQVLNLLDTVGDTPASGSVTTGLAPVSPGPGSPLPWLALIGAGGLLAAGGGVRLSRAGLRRRTGQG